MRILHVIDCINAKQGGPSLSVPRLAGMGAGGRPKGSREREREGERKRWDFGIRISDCEFGKAECEKRKGC